MQLALDSTRAVARRSEQTQSLSDSSRFASQAKVQATECLQFVTDHGM